MTFDPFSEMANRKNTFVCPYINFYVATLRPRQLSHGMDYYSVVRQCPAMVSAIGLLSFFALYYPLLKNIASAAADFASLTLHEWGSGKDFKKSVS